MTELSIAGETMGNKNIAQILTERSMGIGVLLRGRRNELKNGFYVQAFFLLYEHLTPLLRGYTSLWSSDQNDLFGSVIHWHI